jgi:XdhC and CoxI family
MRLKGHLRPLDRIGKPTNLAHDQPGPDRRTADNGRTCCTIASARSLENGKVFQEGYAGAHDAVEVAMRDVVDAIEGWRAEGHRVALATVTKVKGSAPRPPGAKMAISDDGRWVGSVSGGCVEGAVLEEAGRVLAGEPAHLVTFGITDEMVWDVGLACGGIIDVFVEPLP